MTVQQLREALVGLPDNMDVFIADRKTEYPFGLVNSAKVIPITFEEESSGEEATTNCLGLDEE